MIGCDDVSISHPEAPRDDLAGSSDGLSGHNK
jgi:hypothetical protein